METREQRRVVIKAKVRACIVKTNDSGSFKMEYKIGSPPGLVLKCCKSLFLLAHGLKNTMCNDITAEIKHEMDYTWTKKLTTKPARLQLSPKYINEILKIAKSKGYGLSREQIQSLSIPNTAQSVRCFAWMDYYFRLLGDEMPNMNETHLEPTTLLDIHSEYSADMKREGLTPLVYSVWTVFWKNVFPHVKVREFKAVTGKCLNCAMLSHARTKYTRQQHATTMPHQAMSSIQDGMAQYHCLLPHFKNMK
eukprot:gene37208-48631_t